MHFLSFVLLFASQLAWSDGVMKTAEKNVEAHKNQAINKVEDANKKFESALNKVKLAGGDAGKDAGKDGSSSEGKGGGGGGGVHTDISAAKKKGGDSEKSGKGATSEAKKEIAAKEHHHHHHHNSNSNGGGGGGTVDQSTRERLLAEARAERREARRANREAQAYANAALMSIKTASSAGNYQPQSNEQMLLQNIASTPNPYATELDRQLAEHGIGLEEDENEVVMATVGFEESDAEAPELKPVGEQADKQERKPTSAAGTNGFAADQSSVPTVFGSSSFDPSFGPLGDAALERVEAKRDPRMRTNIGYFKTGEGGSVAKKGEELDLSELRQLSAAQAQNKKMIRKAIGLQEQSVEEFHAPNRDIWDMIHLRYQAVTEKNRLNLEIKNP